jgi:hypothetical protein
MLYRNETVILVFAHLSCNMVYFTCLERDALRLDLAVPPPHKRKVTGNLAPIIEQLELRQASLVSVRDLEKLAREAGIAESTRSLSHRLRKNGWLLPLKARGAWEFSPGSRAGALPGGDPLIELRATLKLRPSYPAHVAYDSAAWLLGCTSHLPEREVISLPKGIRVTPALSSYRVVRQRPRLVPLRKDGLPVWQFDSLLVLMCARPELYRDWPNVPEWLPRFARQVDTTKIDSELQPYPKSVRARLSYLFNVANQSELAEKYATHVDYVVYFGSRKRAGRYVPKFRIYDSIFGGRSKSW